MYDGRDKNTNSQTNSSTKALFRSLCILHFCIFGTDSSTFEVLNID